MKKNLLALAILPWLYALPALAATPQIDDESAPDFPKDPLEYQTDDRLSFNRTAAFTRHAVKVNGQNVTFLAFNQLPYVRNQSCPDCQLLDIYIPDAYFNGGVINSYTAKTAPIFLPNTVQDYLKGQITPPQMGASEAAVYALSRGYVVVSPAIRGRDSVNAQGQPVGKAPALLADYKAVVRYLKYNQANLPAGDTSRIIASGTDAGGALSALLGVSGNHPNFSADLLALGAASTDDSIFAAVSFSPVTDLEHADYAYEWQYDEVYDYLPRVPKPGSTEPPEKVAMTGEEIEMAKALHQAFPAYLNSLNLHDPKGQALSLNEDGTGSFAQYLARLYQQAAQRALDRGENLQVEPWAEVEEGNAGKVKEVDLKNYARIVNRLKPAPAFDHLDASSPENEVLGANSQRCHFNQVVIEHTQGKPCVADPKIVSLMNPLSYLGTGESKSAQYFWIRHGTLDRELSLATSAILALSLQGHGATVNFEATYHRPHTGDYELKELFDWLDKLCQK